MNYKFCCDTLSENINEAGCKGFSVIPQRIENQDSYYFILQFRSRDYNDNYKDVMISQMAIKYCPWCGKKLSEVFKSYKNEIIEIAKKNENLVV
jgi:hypothetical protein